MHDRAAPLLPPLPACPPLGEKKTPPRMQKKKKVEKNLYNPATKQRSYAAERK